jgi:hypothetical protein
MTAISRGYIRKPEGIVTRKKAQNLPRKDDAFSALDPHTELG